MSGNALSVVAATMEKAGNEADEEALTKGLSSLEREFVRLSKKMQEELS